MNAGYILYKETRHCIQDMYTGYILYEERRHTDIVYRICIHDTFCMRKQDIVFRIYLGLVYFAMVYNTLPD